LAVLLCWAIGTSPVGAQTSPPPSVLQLPSKTAPAPAAPPTPPRAAPVAPVQQLAPAFAPIATPKPRPTPVVKPPKNTHAQKPPPAKAAVGAPVAEPPPAVTTTTALPVAAAPAAEAAKPSASGAALPRWASLRSDEVNLRTGPGTRYPVEWVYKRRDLPVEIEREFEVWRLVQDQDGVKGWVHQATLTGRRGFVVKGAERVLRRSASEDAGAVAVLKPGVVGRIRSCEAGKAWCEMQVGEYRGWLKRDDVWGIYPGEAVN
jgi:SH3-like domain-containing protein